jgi:hypothetical protein
MTLRQVLGCPQPEEWRLETPKKCSSNLRWGMPGHAGEVDAVI